MPFERHTVLASIANQPTPRSGTHPRARSSTATAPRPGWRLLMTAGAYVHLRVDLSWLIRTERSVVTQPQSPISHARKVERTTAVSDRRVACFALFADIHLADVDTASLI